MVIIKEDIQIVSFNPPTGKAKEIASEFTHPVVFCPAFLYDHIPSCKCSAHAAPPCSQSLISHLVIA